MTEYRKGRVVFIDGLPLARVDGSVIVYDSIDKLVNGIGEALEDRIAEQGQLTSRIEVIEAYYKDESRGGDLYRVDISTTNSRITFHVITDSSKETHVLAAEKAIDLDLKNYGVQIARY